MSSTRAAWYPRSAKTRMPASNSFRIVRRPCARRSRCCAGVPDGPRLVDLDRFWSADLYDLATMLPAIAREAARRFADATAYVAPDGWALSYRDLDRVSDELAVGLARRGLTSGDVLALVLPPSPEYPAAYLAAPQLGTPMAHLGFMTKLPGNLRRGGTSFVMRRWHASDALRLAVEHRMTTVAGVPTQLALMLREPDFDAYDLDSVRFLVVGGGPITPGLAREARERFQAALATRYSCTEAGIGLGTAFDDPEEDAVVSVRRPHRAVDLGVLDEDDRPVPAGDIGQVCLRSPAVMTGYWRDADATRAAFTPHGFVRTGDLGWVDDRGRLRLVGRSKEMYVRGGYNVYPVEIESVLSTHPDVAAVAVVPRSDDVMGEIGVAAVVPRDRDRPPSLAELRAFAAPHIASYKLPDALHVVDALPLTAGEKVDRRALVDEIAKLLT